LKRSQRRYLQTTPVETALAAWLEALGPGPLEPETVRVPDAAGRVLAEPAFAAVSSPHFHAAAMDGIAVRARDTFGASEAAPIRLGPDAHRWVDTGDPLPPDCDAVIMSEDIHWPDDDTAEVVAAAGPWQHVRALGEDIVATELLLPAGHRLRATDIGALLQAGVWEIEARRRPRVALIPTGDEIVDPADRLAGPDGPRLEAGDIVESNTHMQAATVRDWGGEPIRLPIVPDDRESLTAAVRRAADEADIVCVNAGSSAGSEDYTAAVIAGLGEVLVHGVAQRPGKPVILGRLRRGDGWLPVVGVPGYPVSAFLCFELFLRPLVAALLGEEPEPRPRVRAVLSRKLASPAGVEEFIRVKLGRVGECLVASPLSRGAAVITSLVRADGLLRVPRLSEGLAEGAEVEIELLRPRHEIEGAVVVVGSHDPGLDLLGSAMRRRGGPGLSSAHVGSVGGLLALRRGEAHAAGVHLIDEAGGEYNVDYVRRILPGRRVLLLTAAERHQGLMVARGNPKAIAGIGDLARDDVTLVNRQRGAGTRILLDLLLRREGIEPGRVAGYGREEYTHTAVAAAVAGGTADCGLGLLAAARALGLDFIPVARERYELAVPAEYVDTEGVAQLIAALQSPDFHRALEALGGYDAEITGEQRWVE